MDPSSSFSHPFRYFDRDVNCIGEFFQKKFGYGTDSYPKFSNIV